MKKRVSAAIAALTLCAMLSGCAADGGQPAGSSAVSGEPAAKTVLVGDLPASFPLVSSPHTLNVMSVGSGGTDPEDVYVWQRYEDMTDVDVNWTAVEKETRAEEVHKALTNGKKLDLIMRCKLSSNRLMQYGTSGLILDLAKDGMLQQYAPNCWVYLQSHPDTLASVMNPDGTIYALPQVNSGAELRVALKLFVNRQWLERVHMELPTTTEELRALLTAFREQDPNGNGDPDDEIPLCSVGLDSVQYALYGAFGLGNRGYHNMTVDCDPATGGVRLIDGSEPYREFLEYCHELYADGLLDEHTFTLTKDQWLGNLKQDRVGAFVMTNLAWLPTDMVDNWVAIDEALTGPHGDKLWSPIRANFHSTGAAAIPSTCSDPALVLRWLDYFWTDEGTLFYHMGVEGETYIALDDGTYDYMPEIYEEMRAQNLSFDDAVAQYSPYPGGSNPTVEIAPYFMGGEMAEVPAAAARSLMQYGPEEYWPSFTFTDDEKNALDEILEDIEKYCENMRVEFITGARPLTEWDDYLAQLQQLGAPELLHVYQSAADRYHALSTALH
jgi:putative aldouronate transport system substrate-binding protein